MPVGGALFGNSAARTQSKNLVECKAGKMSLKGKMVHPDKRKGLLYVHQADDTLMHFCWKDRQTGTVEDVSRALLVYVSMDQLRGTPSVQQFVLYSQRIETNLLHNTSFYLLLDLELVSARFIGPLQGVICSDVSTQNYLLSLHTLCLQ